MPRHKENTNTIPLGPTDLNETERTVSIGHRGFGGKAAQPNWKMFGVYSPVMAATKLLPQGKRIPNIARHWCVIVGPYYHHLQSTSFGLVEDSWIWYGNDKVDEGDNWDLFEIGKTRFSDAAIVAAGEQAILSMQEKYNIFYNNCQTFVTRILDLICRDGRELASPKFANLEIAFVPTADGKVDEKKAVDETLKEVEVALIARPDEMAELLDVALKHMKDNTPLVAAVGGKGEGEKVVEVSV